MEDFIRKWLGGNGSGEGSGWGSRSGSGDGNGSGDGDGNGSGKGSGWGSGSGSGDGDSNGSGKGSGWGSGSGSGEGDGNGSGKGSGWGSGSGSGEGWGNGSGWGSGNGSGYVIQACMGKKVFYIDGLPTIITSILGNYAKGFTIQNDFSILPCFIVKNNLGIFSHGNSLNEARQALFEKENEILPLEKRLKNFKIYFKYDKKYKGAEFFQWHHILTGSCLFGRKAFCTNNNLNLDKFYSVREFIDLTKNAYGGEIIRRLEKLYE